jgi:hypothetical protein
VLPAVRAAQLDGFLTGVEKAPEQHISITNDDKMVSKEINPAYVSWVAWDQAVLGYMLLSLTRETFIHVSHCSTAAQVWSTLSDLYSSQTRACAVNTCIALATTKKNQPSVSDYYAKISHFADELAASGNPLRNDEIVAYLLAGLDEDFNPVFTAIVERVDPITPSELYSQLLSFKHHTNLQVHNSSGGSSLAMAASHSRGSSGGRGSGGLDCCSGRGRGRGHGPRGGFSNQFTKSPGASGGSSSS